MDWMLMPLRRYAEFSGRSRRKEYWMYTLGLVIVMVVLSAIESALGINQMVLGVYGPLTAILMVATFVPGIAVGVRRLHDTNRSGWWLLALLVPYALFGAGMASTNSALIMAGGLLVLVVAIVLLVFFVSDGTKGANRFGEDPKNPTNAEVFA